MIARKNVIVSLDSALIPSFFGLLRKGIKIEGEVGLSAGEYLRKEIGLSPEYMEERLKTVFLDGKPVDDFDSTFIGDGSTLALSASMPGLAGATMRRGGFYARLRGEISYREKSEAKAVRQGIVSIKLFNVIAHELGPVFLERGVIVRWEDIAGLLNPQSMRFPAGSLSVQINGERVNPDALSQIEWSNDEVFLRVHGK